MPHLGQHDGGEATDRRLVHILRQLKSKLSGPSNWFCRSETVPACTQPVNQLGRAWKRVHVWDDEVN